MIWDQSKLIWTWIKRQNSVVKRHFLRIFWKKKYEDISNGRSYYVFLTCLNFWVVWNLGDLYFRNSWWFFFQILEGFFGLWKSAIWCHCPLQILDFPCKKRTSSDGTKGQTISKANNGVLYKKLSYRQNQSSESIGQRKRIDIE